MANLGNRTRRQQVLLRLQAAQGLWVNGPELATEEIGGSEGLRRVRELAEEGYKIETRRHPDPARDIWQYRIPRGPYVDPTRSEFAAAVEKKGEAFAYIEPTPQLVRAVEEEASLPQTQFTRMPDKIEFGSVAVCPRCKGRTRKYAYPGLEGPRHKDPVAGKKQCLGCNGFGIVPNRGPIPLSMPNE